MRDPLWSPERFAQGVCCLIKGTCSCPYEGFCCECGKPCKDHDLIGNAMDSDGLGSWPKFWCGECINKHWRVDFG